MKTKGDVLGVVTQIRAGYAVARAAGVEGSVSFSLLPDAWGGGRLVAGRSAVLLADLVREPPGWRAGRAAPLAAGDERRCAAELARLRRLCEEG